MAAAPSINSLPYEVRQTIYSLLGQHQTNSYRWNGEPVSTIAHYAAVSREWQEAFERYSFREIRITPKRIDCFSQIVKSPRRRSIVQTLRFHVKLDRYSSYLDGEQETSEERRRSTEILTDALVTFFHAMTHWQKTDTSPLGLDLHLLVDSPSDSSKLLGRNGAPLTTGRALLSHLKLDLETLSLPELGGVDAVVELEGLALLAEGAQVHVEVGPRLPRRRGRRYDHRAGPAETQDSDGFGALLEACNKI